MGMLSLIMFTGCLQKTSIEAKILKSGNGESENSWTVQLTNNSNRIAFFIRPQLLREDTEVLPSYWSSGYFTLAPSETITIRVTSPVGEGGHNGEVIRISGWNVEPVDLDVN